MRYILFNKPYAVLSQFTPQPGKQTLADFLSLPNDIYPAGRLDFDSEGLLLLTNDNAVKHALTDPEAGHSKTYLAQVERIPDAAALKKLQTGITIEGKKTRPADVHLLTEEPDLPERPVPIRFRKNVPTSWLSIVLREGRNRQVRKMTAAVGHPTLRLIRIRIGSIGIGNLLPGEWKELSPTDIVAMMRKK